VTAFAEGASGASAPVLLEYARQFLNSESAARREVAVFCCLAVLAGAPGCDAVDEAWAGLLGHAADVALAKLGDGAVRVVALAVELIGVLAGEYPTLRDFAGLVPPMIQLLDTVLADTASGTLSRILGRLPDEAAARDICSGLLERMSPPALRCVQYCIEKTKSLLVAGSLLTKAVAVAEIMASDQGLVASIDDILHAVDTMVVIVGTHAVGAYDGLFRFAYGCLGHFGSPRALCVMEKISGYLRNPAHFLSTLNQALGRLTDTNSFAMREAAVATVSGLARLGIEDQFGDCPGKLLAIVEDQCVEPELRIACLDAINAMHSTGPERMQPYYGRLVPMYKGLIASIPEIAREDDENGAATVAYVLEALKLMMLVVFPSTCGPAKAGLIEMVLETVVLTMSLSETIDRVDEHCVVNLVDVIKVLLQHNAAETQAFMARTEGLMDFLGEASRTFQVVAEEVERMGLRFGQ